MFSMTKAFMCFCEFRTAIAAGKKPLLFGPDYVAMSRESYDKLMEKISKALDAKNDDVLFWYDERGDK